MIVKRTAMPAVMMVMLSLPIQPYKDRNMIRKAKTHDMSSSIRNHAALLVLTTWALDNLVAPDY